jgi:hypothetical protein
VAGESSSGGDASGSGAFSGDFRGPVATFGVDAGGATSLDVVSKTTAGALDDVSVQVGAVSGPGDEPTLTLLFRGETVALDLDAATSAALAAGLIDEQSVQATAGLSNWDARLLKFNLETSPEYSRLLMFVQTPTAGGLALNAGAFAYGADDIDMPTTGTATYDTGVAGVYLTSAAATDFTEFFSRADVAVHFGNGTVSADFTDVDFLDATGAVVETGPGGIDFGLDLNATITGDDFAGTMLATGAAMTGTVEGDFYGPPGRSPTDIAGAFGIEGAGGVAIGGFQGVCTCLSP